MTETGERRVLPLPDGSTAELNTATRVKMHFTSESREVIFLGGEALFAVVHEANRPFKVRIGSISVEDLGTTFNIRSDDAVGTTISVLEGSVRVNTASPFTQTPGSSDRGANSSSETDLVEGYEATLPRSPPISVSPIPVQIRCLSPGELTHRMAWTRGQLEVIPDAPLGQVIRELNRYQRRKIVLGDSALENLSIGGVFDTMKDNHAAVIVRLLKGKVALDVDQSNPKVIRLMRRSPLEPARANDHSID